MQTQKPLVAKIVINKRLDTFRVQYSLDLFNRISPKNTIFTSGDICDVADEQAAELVLQTVRTQTRDLRANRVILQYSAAARGLEMPEVVDL